MLNYAHIGYQRYILVVELWLVAQLAFSSHRKWQNRDIRIKHYQDAWTQ